MTLFPCGYLCSAVLLVSSTLLINNIFLFVCPKGLVPESEVQRETHEAAELSGRPETRVLPRPEEDEGAGGETGSRGAWTLLLLWRYVGLIIFLTLKTI